MKTPSQKIASELIDQFGGTCVVAKLFGITSGAVSQWRNSGVPDARLMYLKLLRPELFDLDSSELGRRCAGVPHPDSEP